MEPKALDLHKTQSTPVQHCHYITISPPYLQWDKLAMALLRGVCGSHRGCLMRTVPSECYRLCGFTPAAQARLQTAYQRSCGVASTSDAAAASAAPPAAACTDIPAAPAPTSKGYTKRQRLDEYCLQQHPQYSRNLIQSWIAQGKVVVNAGQGDRVVTKAGHAVPKGATVTIQADEPKFVCRAGYKLEKALDVFGVDVQGLVVLDAGLSTGGFSDCLLQRGAAQVRLGVEGA